MQILAAVAEREHILERTNDGRLVAMAAGVKFGRKPRLESDGAMTLIHQQQPARLVMEKTGISRATYFRLNRKISPTDEQMPLFSGFKVVYQSL
ncbi:resolvase [Sodalis sp. RH21]|uniref:resolvase n=1 Tax=unclassified Sodalis (in: enterobacteria) TaxID=2636512 RepID=UPI0039B567FA